MSTKRKSKVEPEKIQALTQICDAESYIQTITDCLSDDQRKLMRPEHMANFMALSAELFLTNYTGIATAFERNNGLEVVFKAKLAQEKDNVEISFKPVDTYKDSASANLPEEGDPDQETMDFVKPKSPTKPVADTVVDAEEVLSLPAPKETLALPNRERTKLEQEAYDDGRDAFVEGFDAELNPYDPEDPEVKDCHDAWIEGFNYERANRAKELEDEAGPLDGEGAIDV